MPPTRRVRATVQPGHKIEIAAPDLEVGQPVDIVLFPRERTEKRHRARDVLARAPGHRLFQTAAEVDAYVRAERDSWGN